MCPPRCPGAEPVGIGYEVPLHATVHIGGRSMPNSTVDAILTTGHWLGKIYVTLAILDNDDEFIRLSHP